MRLIKLINKTIIKWFSEPQYQNIEAFIIYNNKILKRLIDKGPVNGRFPDDRFWRLYNHASNYYEFIPKQDVFLNVDDAKKELNLRLDKAFIKNKLSLKNIKFEKIDCGHLYLFEEDKYKCYFHNVSYDGYYNWHSSDLLSRHLPYAGKIIISLVDFVGKSESLVLDKFNKTICDCVEDNIIVFFYEDQLNINENIIAPIKYGNDYVITCALVGY